MGNSLRAAARFTPRAFNMGKGCGASLKQPTSTNSLKALQNPILSHRYFSAEPELHELGSVDTAYQKDRIDHVAEPERRAFTYLLLSGVRFAYASTARIIVVKFVSSMSASADVLALASAEFELDEVAPGTTITVKWRGKPVFVRRRLPEEISAEEAVPISHLGCVPISGAGEYNGWFCPCHGSHYDVSGRIRKGPAPLNLEVPPYKFTGENKILIG